jgi:hypothetical protein
LGRSLFQEFAASAKVFNSGNDLINHIRASGGTSVIQGYLINSYCFQTSEVTTSFWKLQLSIISQLRLIRSLSIVVAVVIPDHDGRSISAFTRGLTAATWRSYRQGKFRTKTSVTQLPTPVQLSLRFTRPVPAILSRSC